MNTYVAIAYRFGWTNYEWYIVAAGSDREAIEQEAQEECESRAGKYGVGVFEFPGDEQVAYYPSAYGEAKQHMNVRIYAQLEIGTDVMRAIEDGTRSAPDPENEGFAKWVPAEVPNWMRERLEDHIKIGEVLAGVSVQASPATQPETKETER